jgi:hypothetical protein
VCAFDSGREEPFPSQGRRPAEVIWKERIGARMKDHKEDKGQAGEQQDFQNGKKGNTDFSVDGSWGPGC